MAVNHLTDEIRSHRFETMGNHCLLVFTEESSLQGCLGGAGFRPSTVSLRFIWSRIGAESVEPNRLGVVSPYPLRGVHKTNPNHHHLRVTGLQQEAGVVCLCLNYFGVCKEPTETTNHLERSLSREKSETAERQPKTTGMPPQPTGQWLFLWHPSFATAH